MGIPPLDALHSHIIELLAGMRLEALIALLIGSAVASPAIQARQATCAPVHVIVARASGEPKGEGTSKSFSSRLKQAISGADSEAVDYPAALYPYGSSETKGVKAANELLTNYVKRCPETKVVLVGYSQGADVVGSVLCGAGNHVSEQAIGALPKTKVDLGPDVLPVAADTGSHVVAAVMFGDPRFTKGRPFNRGTAKGTGRFPHSENQTCAGYLKRMISYCDQGDEFCDSGNELGPHMTYLSKYSTEAATWVQERVKGATPFPLIGDV